MADLIIERVFDRAARGGRQDPAGAAPGPYGDHMVGMADEGWASSFGKLDALLAS